MRPKIVIVAGPGGAGKNTLTRELVKRLPNLKNITTKMTTRAIRPGEIQGQSYLYVSDDEFNRAIEDGQLLEHGSFNGYQHGVLKKPLEDAITSNQSIILDVETKGAQLIKKQYPDETVLIFITAPLDELRTRYIARGQSSKEADQRLAIAVRDELPMAKYYDLVVENRNGHLDEAVETVAKYLSSC